MGSSDTCGDPPAFGLWRRQMPLAVEESSKKTSSGQAGTPGVPRTGLGRTTGPTRPGRKTAAFLVQIETLDRLPDLYRQGPPAHFRSSCGAAGLEDPQGRIDSEMLRQDRTRCSGSFGLPLLPGDAAMIGSAYSPPRPLRLIARSAMSFLQKAPSKWILSTAS